MIVVPRLPDKVSIAVQFVHLGFELAEKNFVLTLFSGDDLGRFLFDVIGGEVVCRHVVDLVFRDPLRLQVGFIVNEGRTDGIHVYLFSKILVFHSSK